MDKGKTGGNDCRSTEDGTPVKHEESLGADGVFTDEEMLHFVTVLKEGGNGENEDITAIVDWPSKDMFEGLTPFVREQIEEKMAYTAFRSFAPGLPMIPPERFVEVLNFRGAQKLCTSYGLGSKERWPKLRAKLVAKRKEILTAYREKLTSDMRMRLQSELMAKGKASDDSSREHKRQQIASAGSEGLAAPAVHPGNIWEKRKPVFTAPKPASPRTPGFIPEGPNRTYRVRNECPVFYDEHGDTTEANDAEVTWAEARYPTPPKEEDRLSASRVGPDKHLVPPFVTLRRKKAPREAGHPFVERLKESLARGEGIPGSLPVRSPDLGKPVFALQASEKSHSLAVPRQIINEDESQRARLAQGPTHHQNADGYVRDYPVFFPPSPPRAHSMDVGNDQSRSRTPFGSPPFKSSPVGERDDQSYSLMGRGSRLHGFRLRNSSVEELDRKAAQSGPLSDSVGIQHQAPQHQTPREDHLSSNAHNYHQLVPDMDYYSDEVVPYDNYESEDEEASQDGYSADFEALEDEDDMRLARPSSPNESPTSITLRKLAKMRDNAIKRKAALAHLKDEQMIRPQKQTQNLMTSPDSDYSLDGALHRSPPGTRLLCAFTFRGYRFEMPVSGGPAQRIREDQIRRGRLDYWTVREDPESPTPVRCAPPGPDPDRFLLDSESEGELLYPSEYTDDLDTDEVTVDMELTVPLPSNIVVF